MKLDENFSKQAKIIAKLIIFRKKYSKKHSYEAVDKNANGEIICFKKGYFKRLHRITNEIFSRRPYLSEVICEDDLEKEVRNILLDAKRKKLEKSKNVFAEKLRAMLSKIKNNVCVWIVITPLGNIKIKQKQEIGAVNFVNGKNVQKYLSKNKINIEAKQWITNYKEENYAICSVSAHSSDKAQEKAKEKIEKILNWLRLFYPLHNFGIKGYYDEPKHYTFIPYNLKTKSIGHHGGITRQTGNIVISKQAIKDLKKFGLKKIQKIEKKENKTQLEKKILNAINWFGQTVKYDDLINNHLRVIAALDSLVLQGPGEGNELFSERIAYLYTKNKKDRKTIYKIAKKAYLKRNKIVHNADLEIDKDNYIQIWQIQQQLIFILLKKTSKFKETADIANFVEKEKFS